METYTTQKALIARIQELIANDPSPYHRGHIGQWLNKYSEVDLHITDKGPIEIHNELYTGNTYEITITTRAFKDKATKGRFE